MKACFVGAALLSLSSAEVLTVAPGESIQAAIDLAQPGDTIELEKGMYNEELVSSRDGEEGKPITITGSRDAVLSGTGKTGRLFEINHFYWTVNGFTIDGKMGEGEKEEDFQDKLLYVIGNRETRVIKRYGTEFRSSIDGIVISNMHLTRASGECLRLRYFVTGAEIFGNVISNCGIGDFVFGGMKAKNGEVIYVGTSSNQWSDGKGFSDEPDVCRFIHIHHNEFRGHGNECQVKEASREILIEHNICATQRDPDSACIDARNDATIVRYNLIFENDGAGVRIGGHTINGHEFGQQAEVYGNILHDNEEGAIKIQTGAGTHKICENECKGDDCKVGGSASDEYQDITEKCSDLIDIFWVDDTKTVPVASAMSAKTKSIDGEPDDAEEAAEPEFNATVEDKPESTQSKKCFPVEITKTHASSEQGEHTSKMAVDNKSMTRWSAEGKQETLTLEFSSAQKIDAIEISFLKGDERTQSFEVAVDGKTVLEKQESSGKTLAMQRFLFKEVEGSSVTVTGFGNSQNQWNSLTELIVCGVEEQQKKEGREKSGKPEDLCSKVEKLEISKVGASADDGKNKPSNAIDGDLETRWAMDGPEEQDISVELEKPSTVTEIGLAVHDGDENKAFFDVMVETEEHGWEEVVVDGESVKGKGIESYDLGMKAVKSVKVVCYGSEDRESGEALPLNSFTEIELYGCL
ncbi:unnamed protein product [Ectocarpus sp. 12 AP-2014]